MKKIFVITGAVLFFTACSNQKTTETGSSDTTTVNTNADTATYTTTTNNYSSGNAYVPAEGDVTYRNGKVYVWRNNAYTEADDDINLDDSIIVRRNGQVIRNGQTMVLEDSQYVSKSGKFFDKVGQGIENAWDATKTGVSKAAKGVKKAGSKVGQEIKEAIH